MPASVAMSSVEAPCSPDRANAAAAATRTASRRSSAVRRMVDSTEVIDNSQPCPLSRSPETLDRGAHPLDLRLRRRRRERQRERSLEGTVGAGELSSALVRAEPMDGVRADLALDP